jgi:hypothetical protein
VNTFLTVVGIVRLALLVFLVGIAESYVAVTVSTVVLPFFNVTVDVWAVHVAVIVAVPLYLPRFV